MCPALYECIDIRMFNKFLLGKPPLASMDDGLVIITTSADPCQDSSAMVQAVEAGKDGGIGG